MDVHDDCDSFVEHRWKADFCSNCFRDKGKHTVNPNINQPQMSVSKSRIYGALDTSSRRAKLNTSNLDSHQEEGGNGIDSAGRSGLFATTPHSILPQDADSIEGFMGNVVSDDKFVSLSKQPGGAGEVIRPPLGLTQDKRYDIKRPGNSVGVEGCIHLNEASEARGDESILGGENSFIASSSSRSNSGSETFDSSSLPQNWRKYETEGRDFDEVEQRLNREQKQAGTGPKNGGNSRCLDSNLPSGSVNCEEYFSCDAIKDNTNQSKVNDRRDSDIEIRLAIESVQNSGSDLHRPIVDMVFLQGKEGGKDAVVERNSSRRRYDSAIANNRRTDIGAEKQGMYGLNNNAESRDARKRKSGTPDEFKFASETAVTYANVVNEPRSSERHRQVFETGRRSRNDSIDSTDETFSPRIQRKFQGDYECMSNPDSFSTSSSNRSSNTSSLHSNYSPDSLSLASFAVRYNFGKCEGSKRCSQASSASQDSGRQSWPKSRDSFDSSDSGSAQFDRRSPSEHVYENNNVHGPDAFLKWNQHHQNKMEELPPPLPARQFSPSPSGTKAPGVELIMPYKVVDLDELQKSLEDIDPYSVYYGSNSVDEKMDGQYIDSQLEPERTTTVPRDGDFRPALPPKQRTLSQSKSDSSGSSGNSSEGTRERPTPLPRQSMVSVDDIVLPRRASGSDLTSTDEETSPTDRSAHVGGRLSRQKSLPSGRVTRSRRDAMSPQNAARPRRMAPPPPPSHSSTPHKNDQCIRPVSEMFPPSKPGNSNASSKLKRSNTITLLQSPFSRMPLEKISGGGLEHQSTVQVTSSTSEVVNGNTPSSQTSQTGLVQDEKPVQSKEGAPKSGPSKTGVFFAKTNVLKKALITLKKPVTKKQAKKELVISAPMDFTSLYQPKLTADDETREEKNVSLLDSADPGKKVCPDVDTKTEKLDEQDEQVYHNFPISQATDNPEEKLSPKKPPRNFSTTSLKDQTNCSRGYLQPSTSQQTKDQEDEISRNKLPALGPLPSPPAESPSPLSDASTTITGQDTCKGQENAEAERLATKPRPRVPRRPESFKLKRKFQNKGEVQVNEKPTSWCRNPSPRTSNGHSFDKPSKHNIERGNITSKATTGRSRSCELLNVEDSRDNYLTDMHLTVLKDILLRWRNMLRKPAINLTGACWEDFEAVEVDSWPKISDDEGSIHQPVQLKKSSRSLDSQNCGGQFMAKIKTKTQTSNSTKSCYDQDYSICTSVESHENVARVLAYFRGDIKLPLLGLENGKSQIHTTISISDQVPTQTCDEFVAESVEFYNKDPHSYERTVCLLMLQCLKGLEHLHDTGFTHGNLTLSNMFLIRHANDFQLFLGNFGKCQPLPKERRGTGTNCRTEDVAKPSGLRNDLIGCSNILSGMLLLEPKCNDANNKVVNISDSQSSPMFGFLKKASTRLRNGTTTLRRTIRLIQGLLWGPFKSGEVMCVLSENRAREWLERQRAEFIARLAMDEALSRTLKSNNQPRFSMEDLMLCEYLGVANPDSLIRTMKCWLLDS